MVVTHASTVRPPATGPSILFSDLGDRANADKRDEPDFFPDLHLDRVVEAIVNGREEHDLTPFFHSPLPDVDAINYRHEVFRDLDDPDVRGRVEEFADRMRRMREHLDQVAKLHYEWQRHRWFLDAVTVYRDAVDKLAEDLTGIPAIRSRGFLALRDYLAGVVASPEFAQLREQTTGLINDLAEVRYCLNIRGNRVRVTHYDDEPDYSAEVADTFAKFRQGAVREYRGKFSDWPEMNHVEAGILDQIVKLHPELFARLASFHENHQDFLDATIAAFDREVQFYLAYREHLDTLRAAGLRFCYPTVSAESKNMDARGTFDIALAALLVAEKTAVVSNDIQLSGPERIFVVTGPNQGGKTTFARTIGQLHYLASLGCLVPGLRADLFLPDAIFSHFEREEDITNLTGKLHDDLNRIHGILDRATPSSLIIMNEVFTSTTLHDALFLGRKVLQWMIDLDLLAVYVTFVDELTRLGDSIVSVASTVDPNNPAERTYRIVRRPADGRAYAITLAEKYRLTYDNLTERIPS